MALAERHSEGRLLGRLARMTAERDAGHLAWLASPESPRTLPGATPEDLVMGIPLIFRTYFQGGLARVDFLEPQEAGISLWMWDLHPGWATIEAPEWIRTAMEDGYAARAKVTYLTPNADRPWWHRYHITWSE